jgi:hypothetical protein
MITEMTAYERLEFGCEYDACIAEIECPQLPEPFAIADGVTMYGDWTDEMVEAHLRELALFHSGRLANQIEMIQVVTVPAQNSTLRFVLAALLCASVGGIIYALILHIGRGL